METVNITIKQRTKVHYNILVVCDTLEQFKRWVTPTLEALKGSKLVGSKLVVDFGNDVTLTYTPFSLSMGVESLYGLKFDNVHFINIEKSVSKEVEDFITTIIGGNN